MARLEEIARPDPAPNRREITEAEASAMARAVIRLFDHWSLTDAEACVMLGGLSPRTWQRWKSGEIGRIPRDLKARLSNLVGIHKALRLIFRDAEQGYGWISRPNTRFGGRSARAVMLGGELTDLMRVRAYLDAERGW